eukprot:scaffold4992_cov156-Skeletonema_dohrnii-CCMP3373.AAC.7
MEQQLREKIASQKISLANLPTLRSVIDERGLASPETKARAQLIKELSDNEEQLELLIESKRVAAVVCLQDELHPPEYSEDCPICLETIKHVNDATIIRLFCCGGWICTQCSDARNAKEKEGGSDEMYRDKCPLCREKITNKGDYKGLGTRALEHANKGKAWAQMYIGSCYMGGTYGFALDKEKGLQLLEQAVDQRYPDAVFMMALAYKGEMLERNESKYLHYLKAAANLGQQDAQLELALTYNECNSEKEHLHYITLAANNGNYKACSVLGAYFMTGECGLIKSLILAKHYCEKSLEDEDVNGLSAYIFSSALLQLGHDRYEGIMEIPGHSPIPKALFWARKGLEDDSFPLRDNLTFILSATENEVKSHCANCRKEAEGSSLKRCVRCLGAWYCGKECQVQHWKAGHKIDCIKR